LIREAFLLELKGFAEDPVEINESNYFELLEKFTQGFYPKEKIDVRWYRKPEKGIENGK
jgi:hypothetical protein